MIEISGFTLFHTNKSGWQLSVRVKGENGWLVTTNFSDEKAQQILLLVGDHLPSSTIPIPQPGKINLRPSRGRVIL